MNLLIDPVNSPDEWALNICKALGNVKEYWNPEGGVEFFDTTKYEQSDIKINFLKIDLLRYTQKRREFEPGLSIIDAMMFNNPLKIKDMLDNYKLL